jgi:metabolite-proton symporter
LIALTDLFLDWTSPGLRLCEAMDSAMTKDETLDVTDAKAATASTQRRVVASAFIGTLIEWYDFFLYGTAAALVFNKLFFPSMDPVAGTMASFGTYAAGFLARPFGGIVFGHFGDKSGRKTMLVITLLMMGLSTFLIGLLPTYNKIGIVAPILLITLRLVQGLALGGEWGGAVLLAVEHSQKGRRGFNASWAQAGSPAGLLLSTAVFAFVARRPEAEFLSWGWRVPFLVGIILTGIGLFIRFKVPESPLFEELHAGKRGAKRPIVEVLRSHWKSVLLIMGARLAENACFYVFTVFSLAYATTQLQLPKSVILNAVLLAAALEFVTIPLFGALSDRIGRRPVYIGGSLFIAIFAFPFFWLVNTREAPLVGLAVVCVMAIGHAAMYAPQAAFFSELFATRVRFSGASLGYQLSAPLAGGLAPLICTMLMKVAGGGSWLVAIYLMVIGVITFGCVLATDETNKIDISKDR